MSMFYPSDDDNPSWTQYGARGDKIKELEKQLADTMRENAALRQMLDSHALASHPTGYADLEREVERLNAELGRIACAVISAPLGQMPDLSSKPTSITGNECLPSNLDTGHTTPESVLQNLQPSHSIDEEGSGTMTIIETPGVPSFSPKHKCHESSGSGSNKGGYGTGGTVIPSQNIEHGKDCYCGRCYVEFKNKTKT